MKMVQVKDAGKSESLVVMARIEVEFLFFVRTKRDNITSSES